MAVARVSEIVASSTKSWEDAARTGFRRAGKTLRGITGFEIIKQTAHVENNKIVEFRVTMRVIFVLDE
ncbi:MAG: dodecin family protein [Candidatus Krumholzibacteriaceae bacterium]|jgi:flavin-binding protein dodecin